MFVTVWALLCLAVTWVIGRQDDAFQRLVHNGLRATQDVRVALAVRAAPWHPQEHGWAARISALRGAVEALEREARRLSWLLPTSDGIDEVIRAHKDLQDSVSAGNIEEGGSWLQLSDLRNRLDALDRAWLRVSTAQAGRRSATQRIHILAAGVAFLVMLLLALLLVKHSDSTVQRALRFLESTAARFASGDIPPREPSSAAQETGQLPESLAGFSESLELLARLLRGHCQVTVKLLDLFPSGVALMSGSFRVLAANHPFCRLAGGTPDLVQGRHLGEVLPAAMPALTVPGDGGSLPRGRDSVVRLEKQDGEQVYHAHLAEILPGQADGGVLVLMLAELVDSHQGAPDHGEFKKLYEELLESVSEAILLVEGDGSVIDVSPHAERLLGQPRSELTGARLQSLQAATPNATEETLDTYFSSSHWRLHGRVLKTRVVRRNGAPFSAEFRFREFKAGGRAGYLVFLCDVSEQELAESLARERLHVIELIARNHPLETVLTGVTELVEHQVPGSYCAVVLKQGNRLTSPVAPRLPEALVELLDELPLDRVTSACTQSYTEGEAMLRNHILTDGTRGALREEALKLGIHSCLSTPVFSSDGRVVGLIAAFRPETEEPRKEQAEMLQLAGQLASVCIEQRELTGQLAHKAQHDPLTGLLNRCSFEERLNHAIAHAGRHNRRLAVLSLDLDRFKVVNDTLGHAAGDGLLRQLSVRLAGSLRETDLIARWGGDEFVIGLVEIQSRKDAEVVADKLLSALAAPFDSAGRSTTVSASIGVSVFPSDGLDLETLLRHADTAMYQAKKSGRNGFHCYDTRLGETDRQRLELETQLRRALECGELVLHYQPQIDTRTRSLVGVEALLRWQSRKLGCVAPSSFIPIAEECGAIVPIGEWVIRQACRQAKEFGLAGLGDVRVAVNVSRAQFARADFVEVVAAAVEEAGVEPRLLEIELTETLLMEPGDEATARMGKLRALGIKMSIDDFGTGYSSLSYLQRLPIDHLKIDQSFVRQLDASSRTSLLVESIIALSAGLGMLCIAEGVESASQLDVLNSIGCNLMQGNLFSPPLPAAQLIRHIGRHSRGKGWQPAASAGRRRRPATARVASAGEAA